MLGVNIISTLRDKCPIMHNELVSLLFITLINNQIIDLAVDGAHLLMIAFDLRQRPISFILILKHSGVDQTVLNLLSHLLFANFVKLS